MSLGTDALAGRLTLHPGGEPPIRCERPMIGEAMMRRLAAGRRAALLPDLVGTVFTLCAAAQRSTARRAIGAALGLREDADAAMQDRQLMAMATAREHLQRLALDLPGRVPALGADDAHWLRDAPLLALPARPDGHAAAGLRAAARSLPHWLERRLLGLPPQDWLARWEADPAGWLAQWSDAHDHPLAAWLRAVRDDALQTTLPCRPLAPLEDGEPGLHSLAISLADEPGFARRPVWRGAAAETGPWTRHGRSVGPAEALSLWIRLGARLADLVQIALGRELACGAFAPGRGEGLAWTEMSRGLLLHWVRLEPGPMSPDTARIADYRVLAPTEWNFHPHGALANALRTHRLAADRATLAAATMDPCIHYEIRDRAEEAAGA